MIQTVESLPQTISERENHLRELIEEHRRLKKDKLPESAPKVQYAVQQFRKALRAYERAVDEGGE